MIDGPEDRVTPTAGRGSVAGKENDMGPADGIGGKGVDLQAAMLALESQRVDLLETQINGLTTAIQDGNNEIVKLNELADVLNTVRPSGTDPDDAEQWAQLSSDPGEVAELYKELDAAGATIPKIGDEAVEGDSVRYGWATQNIIDGWVEQLEGRIDSLNANQQLDMLRLQSLMSQRDEALERIAAQTRKMLDSPSSIPGNTR